MVAGEFSVSTIMRAVVAACQTPVVVILLVLLAVAVLCVGWIVGEYFFERRRFRVFLPRLVEALKDADDDPAEVVKQSGLLLRQKQYLIEITRHPGLTDAMRESLAVGLEYKERRRYDITVKITDMIARIAPVFGLLGTLIPLGPGIMALSDGDTATLSASLIVAFDTTSTGLMISVVALIISAIRKRWYKDYMVSFDAVLECLLEVEKAENRGKSGVLKKAAEAQKAVLDAGGSSLVGQASEPPDGLTKGKGSESAAAKEEQ